MTTSTLRASIGSTPWIVEFEDNHGHRWLADEPDQLLESHLKQRWLTPDLSDIERQAILEAAGGAVLAPDGRPFRYNQRATLLNGDFLALGDIALRDRLPG